MENLTVPRSELARLLAFTFLFIKVFYPKHSGARFPLCFFFHHLIINVFTSELERFHARTGAQSAPSQASDHFELVYITPTETAHKYSCVLDFIMVP